MDAQRALVEGGKDDAGTGELVDIFFILGVLVGVSLIQALVCHVFELLTHG